jgi:glutamate 5-kinase
LANFLSGLKLKNLNQTYKRIAIKVGSNVLSLPNGTLNTQRIEHIVSQIAELRQKGIQIILISSGAVAAGRGEYKLSKKTPEISAKQVWSAIGQVKLMSTYFSAFGKYKIQAAQVLTTKENFSDRRHYLNMKNCISAMLDNKIVPVVNENDTISVNELMFTDNDELSGLIASLMDCQALLILSNVDGVLSGHPDDDGAELIPEIEADDKSVVNYVSPVKSGFGRGGMLTKCSIAQKIAMQGINVYIANGSRDNIIMDILYNNKVPFTRFKALSKKVNSVKKWLSHSSTFAKGTVIVNKGAAEALKSKSATSLLTIGIEKLDGFFEKGDLVKIFDNNNKYIGLGKAKYGSVELGQSLGLKKKKPFIHYDYLVLNDEND